MPETLLLGKEADLDHTHWRVVGVASYHKHHGHLNWREYHLQPVRGRRGWLTECGREWVLWSAVDDETNETLGNKRDDFRHDGRDFFFRDHHTAICTGTHDDADDVGKDDRSHRRVWSSRDGYCMERVEVDSGTTWRFGHRFSETQIEDAFDTRVPTGYRGDVRISEPQEHVHRPHPEPVDLMDAIDSAHDTYYTIKGVFWLLGLGAVLVWMWLFGDM